MGQTESSHNNEASEAYKSRTPISNKHANPDLSIVK